MRMFVRDSAVDLPAAGQAIGGGPTEGDLALALDTGQLYFWDTAWVPLSASGAITVKEIAGTVVGGTTVLEFDEADGFTVTDIGGGTARVNVTTGGGPGGTEDTDARLLAYLALMGMGA